MELEMIALGELIKPATLKRAGSREYPILSMTMRHGLVEQSDKFKKRVASVDTSTYKVVSHGQLVVGFPIDEGVLSFQKLHPEAIVSPAYGVWDLKRDVCDEYLERYLRSPRALAYYASKLRGTTARRRSLPQDTFLKLLVPMPSRAMQEQVVGILGRVDALRVKRQASIALLDDLMQSIFLAMFGNPVRNDRHWPECRVADFVAGFESGKSLSAGKEDDPSAYRILKVSAVTSGTFDSSESKLAPPDYSPPASHIVRDGDLLFSRANTSELIGATAIAQPASKNLLLPDKIWRFVWHAAVQVDPVFVHHLFRQRQFRDQIRRNATGSSSSMKNISQAKVMSLHTGLPPYELQTSFAEQMRHLDVIRMSYVKQLVELDGLFGSLQQRAFRGELWEG